MVEWLRSVDDRALRLFETQLRRAFREMEDATLLDDQPAVQLIARANDRIVTLERPAGLLSVK